jgi:hypothetical protein
MSPLARRGRIVYTALATVLIAWQLFGISFHLFSASTNGGSIEWWRAVLRPLIFVGIVIGMRDDRLMRWAVAVWMCISGALPVFAALMLGSRLAAETPPAQIGLFVDLLRFPLAVLALLGLVQIAIGCAVLWLPSLSAYFNERRAAASSFEAV